MQGWLKGLRAYVGVVWCSKQAYEGGEMVDGRSAVGGGRGRLAG